MDSETKLTLSVLGIIAAAVCTFALIIECSMTYRHKLAIENGYEEVQNIGTSGSHWKRVK